MCCKTFALHPVDSFSVFHLDPVVFLSYSFEDTLYTKKYIREDSAHTFCSNHSLNVFLTEAVRINFI